MSAEFQKTIENLLEQNIVPPTQDVMNPMTGPIYPTNKPLVRLSGCCIGSIVVIAFAIGIVVSLLIKNDKNPK